jgi:hypothetical protein
MGTIPIARLGILVGKLTLLAPVLVLLACGGNERAAIREAEVPEAEYFTGDLEEYPRPIPVTVVRLADELPVIDDDQERISEIEDPDKRVAASTAVELSVVSSEMRTELEGRALADDEALLVVNAGARNVHPKQEVERSRLEGKQDRTLGSGGLLRGEGGGSEEMVDVDVAYKIPRLADHFFILADGIAYPLFGPEFGGGSWADPDSGLSIEKQGEVEELRLAAVVPRQASHLALQLLDYANGHVTAPIRGKVKRARSDDQLPTDSLAEAATSQLEIAARAVKLQDEYGDRLAPSGRQFAVVELVGRSRSASGGMGNIVELDPTRYLWVIFDDGYLAYSEPPSSPSARVIRFPPQLLLLQKVAFLVDERAENLTVGIRVQNEVVELPLTGHRPRLPSPSGRHIDGEVMEVLLFGSRVSGDRVVVDLGIRSLLEEQGLEVQPSAQFLLSAGDRDVAPERTATGALSHPPPDPFIVPPGVAIRFDLAYTTAEVPSALRVRGFRTDGTIELRP